jgi:RNA polymerase sigma-70 factor (ECF subfamily)
MAAVPSHDVDDEELARRARSGDPDAFEVLMTRYSDRVYRLGLRLTGNRHDAEEVLQETFLRVFRRLATFRGESLFSTWLYRVAANNALMLVRARKRRRTEPLDRYMPLFDGSGRHRRDVDHARAARADEILDRRRLAQAALGALQRLPPIHRTAFVLRDLQDLPTAQVAEVLGVTPATVRQRVHRARLSMRGYLSHLVGVEP